MKEGRSAHEAAAFPRPAVRPVLVALKALCCMGLCVTAFASHATMVLLALSGANLVLMLICRIRPRAWWRGAKIFASQTAFIVGLYVLRFGVAGGLWPGFRTSWQLFLALLPGVILVETTAPARMQRLLSYLMPYRWAFVMTTCLRFLPLVVEEMRTIREGQVMRGARILPGDLCKPWNWPDVVHCLLVPIMVRSMKLAADIALAAKVRDFDAGPKRTVWPGE